MSLFHILADLRNQVPVLEVEASKSIGDYLFCFILR